jgi:hypothetical protein
MPGREFGFICEDFSVGMSSNGFVLPGSENMFFGKSLIPGAQQDEISGRYLMQVHHRGKVVCRLRVEIGWGTHHSQVEPFLGIRVRDPAALREELGRFSGQHVELQFTPVA